MLSKVKLALRISGSDFDPEILDLIAAGIKDLNLDGTYFDYTVSTSDIEIDDPLISHAITTFCKVNFGETDRYDQLKASYDEQKAQLRCNPDYAEEPDGSL